MTTGRLFTTRVLFQTVVRLLVHWLPQLFVDVDVGDPVVLLLTLLMFVLLTFVHPVVCWSPGLFEFTFEFAMTWFSAAVSAGSHGR